MLYAPSWPAARPFRASPRGTLESGRQTAVLLFFDTPARSLARATFDFDVVAADGTKLGTIRIPYERG